MPKTMAKKSARKVAKKPALTGASPRGEETRARLLDAAYSEFRRNGFHGTSMRQIAQATEMAVGGIYNHFHSKEEIFAAVLDARHPYHVILPALAESQGETLEDFMRDAGRRVQAAVRGVEDQMLPLIFIELVEFQGRHLKALVTRLFPTMMGFAQRIAERPGALRPIPLPVIMRSFIAMTIGHLLVEMILKDTPLFETMRAGWYDSMLDIYLHGVVAPGAPAAEG